ncbi:hypothetical protein HY357_03780 [Candidatus Roizmanbacteria bacterium]|nr:hypothetical protein [Candidatus Roizmanbacteria bacterium]
MKLLLLHGPAKDASRKKLIEIKQQFDNNNVVVYEEGFDMQTVLGSLATPSLFSKPQLMILENPLEDIVFDSSLITYHSSLILWFDHELSEKKPIMEWVKKNGQVLFFPEAKEISIFPFLDYLAFKDQRAFLELNKLKKSGIDIQYYITMIFYLLRNLVATPKGARPFVREKLQRQRKNFSLEKITGLYKQVLEIDFKIKSGLLEKDHAEFLLVNLFCRQI